MTQTAECERLKYAFEERIFYKGLWREAVASDRKTLVSDVDGIYIGSLWMCGRIMITISQGELGTAHYSQITFMASNDNPSDMFVKSHEGTYKELLDMLIRAGERFEQGEPVMKPDALIYAGVRIGGN